MPGAFYIEALELGLWDGNEEEPLDIEGEGAMTIGEFNLSGETVHMEGYSVKLADGTIVIADFNADRVIYHPVEAEPGEWFLMDEVSVLDIVNIFKRQDGLDPNIWRIE